MISPGSAIPAGPDDVRAGAGEVPDAAGGRPGGAPAQGTARAPARGMGGHLADVPFDRDWHVPASGVVTGWRGKVPPAVMEELFWQVAGPLAGGGGADDDDDGGPVLVLGGMPVCGIDGMLVNLADTPANRAMFGCTGTRSQKGLGSAPFPQLLAVVITARAGRAKLGAITGKARAGEQTLLARLIRRRPDLFAGRVTVFDRNFPGHKIITAILDAGGHVVARAKSDLALPAAPGGGGWASRRAPLGWLDAPGRKMSGRPPVPGAEPNPGPAFRERQGTPGNRT